MIKGTMLTLLSFVLLSSAAFTQDNKFKFSGKIYYDYMHGISSDGPRTDGSENGFMFRRAYFTVNKNIDDNFAVRFRTDADRKADAKLRPFLKHLYLQWKTLVPAASLYIGMSGTPTWGVAEKVWGYRGLSKTAWDKFKDVTGVSNSASSAAVGLALKGSVAEKKVNYHTMISNGAGSSKPETDHQKKLYASVSTKISEIIVAGYVDQESKGGGDNNLTLKGFVGYDSDGKAFGAEYYTMNMGVVDVDMTALSLFGRLDVSENSTAILRYDMYDTDTDTDGTETGLLMVAFDYQPAKGVSVIPNFNYFMNSGDLDDDIIAYLTFVWSFK